MTLDEATRVLESALADAEIEYHDHVSPTIWVKFPVKTYDEDRYSVSDDERGENGDGYEPASNPHGCG